MLDVLKGKVMVLFVLLMMGVTYISSEQIKMDNISDQENLIIMNA